MTEKPSREVPQNGRQKCWIFGDVTNRYVFVVVPTKNQETKAQDHAYFFIQFSDVTNFIDLYCCYC
jgi:hypothetical protein